MLNHGQLDLVNKTECLTLSAARRQMGNRAIADLRYAKEHSISLSNQIFAAKKG